MTSATAALAQVKGGKLRIVGVTSRQRIPGAPEFPALAEAVAGFEVNNDLFLLAPADTPAPAIAALNAALKSIFSNKDLQESYLAQGALVELSTHEELVARIVRDVAKWRAVAKESGIRAE